MGLDSGKQRKLPVGSSAVDSRYSAQVPLKFTRAAICPVGAVKADEAKARCTTHGKDTLILNEDQPVLG